MMFRKWVFAPCGNRATRKYPAKYLRAQAQNRLRLRLGDREKEAAALSQMQCAQLQWGVKRGPVELA